MKVQGSAVRCIPAPNHQPPASGPSGTSALNELGPPS